MNQKQQRQRVKARRADQKRSKARTRAVAVLDDLERQSVADLADAYAAGTAADRKAIEARYAEAAELIAADPLRARTAIATAREIVAAPIGRNRQAGRTFDDEELPRLHAKVRTGLTALRTTVPDACAHLTPQSPIALACLDEPGTVMCGDCCQEHSLDGHGPEWDYQCLECGGVDMRGISPVMVTPILGLPVRFGGEVAVFIAPVVMTGLGVCNPCRLAAGKKRDRSATRTAAAKP